MQTIQLIYASLAHDSVGYKELSQILEHAQKFNSANLVSGILCYGDGAFLQVLEGRRTTVNSIYNKIVKDPRNMNTEILSCTPINTRRFQDWSMKMVSLDSLIAPQRRALLHRYSGGTVFEPWLLSARQGHDFLFEMAEQERKQPLNRRLAAAG